MNCFEMSQIAAVRIRTVCEALQADDAGEACDTYRLTEELNGFSAFGDRLVVERRYPAAQEVHYSAATAYAEMLLASHVLGRERLVVVQTPATNPLQEAQDRGIGLGTIRDEQIAVLGCANVPWVDDGKTTYHPL